MVEDVDVIICVLRVTLLERQDRQTRLQ